MQVLLVKVERTERTKQTHETDTNPNNPFLEMGPRLAESGIVCSIRAAGRRKRLGGTARLSLGGRTDTGRPAKNRGSSYLRNRESAWAICIYPGRWRLAGGTTNPSLDSTPWVVARRLNTIFRFPTDSRQLDWGRYMP